MPGGTRARLEGWARTLRRDAHAVWLAARDPRMPRHLRWLALATVAYALSPIDLIPDAIPLLGLLDDLIVVPLGLALVLRLAPAELVAECRRRAAADIAAGADGERAAGRLGATLVVVTWLASAALLAWLLLRG